LLFAGRKPLPISRDLTWWYHTRASKKKNGRGSGVSITGVLIQTVRVFCPFVENFLMIVLISGEAARAGFKCDDEALQTKFKLWHEKHRTQRSFLLRLYRKFGAAVLLDPTWDLTTANDLPSHSKSCVQTLDYIERKVDDDFDLSALQKQSKAFLLQYLKTVNGDPVGEWTDRALTALE
jgi:hypothetical protein